MFSAQSSGSEENYANGSLKAREKGLVDNFAG